MALTFRGGVHPAEMKNLTESAPIKKMRTPKKVVIPLSQHIGAVCKPLVKAGDTVKIGDRIGESDKFISSPVHSSINGTVVSVEIYTHPVLGKCESVIIEGEGSEKYEKWERHDGGLGEENLDSLSRDGIVDRVLNAGIVGMGGAAFPTHVKLSPPGNKPIDTFILNGAECEPYLTCDYRVMLERADDVIKGTFAIMKALGVSRGFIGIEDNKPEAAGIMKKAAEKGNGTEILTVKIVKTKYPQGAEKQLIKAITGREVPAGGLPLDVGIVVNNVGTALAVSEALAEGKPLYERVVTVTGKSVRNPGNLLVKIGTLVNEIIEECGGIRDEKAAKIIMGGPMMGLAQSTAEVPVVKGTCGILILSAAEVKEYEPGACISCARCIQACPVGLLPNYISAAVEKERFYASRDYGALDCFECGVCSYVCPAKRRLAESAKYAKLRLSRK